MSDDLRIIETSDGSHSIESTNYKASYHSLQGAIEEAMHVFMSAGIYYKLQENPSNLSVFEMGFGTGLNAYLSYLTSLKFSIPIHYTSIELHPIPASAYEPLNYYKFFERGSKDEFQKLHSIAWNENHQLSPLFSLKKSAADLTTYIFESMHDLIFYDAFAPSAQPVLWEEKIHRKIYEALNHGGALVTYCAQGKFKRLLKEIGYELQSLNGPSRKHEMTRAVKN